MNRNITLFINTNSTLSAGWVGMLIDKPAWLQPQFQTGEALPGGGRVNYAHMIRLSGVYQWEYDIKRSRDKKHAYKAEWELLQLFPRPCPYQQEVVDLVLNACPLEDTRIVEGLE